MGELNVGWTPQPLIIRYRWDNLVRGSPERGQRESEQAQFLGCLRVLSQGLFEFVQIEVLDQKVPVFQGRGHGLTTDLFQFLQPSRVGSNVDDFKFDVLLLEVGQSVYAPWTTLLYVEYWIVHTFSHSLELKGREELFILLGRRPFRDHAKIRYGRGEKKA